MTKEKATPIIILGMHRSGTSCLAGALQQAGLYLGKVSEYNAYNKKGNREHNEIMSLNDSILQYNNASWDNPPRAPLKWTQAHVNKANNLILAFENNTTTGYWGFKDPRTLLTLAFWEKLLTAPFFVGTFRNPLNVAHSLCKRGDFSFNKSATFLLWNIYNNILISKVKSYSIPLVSFDLPPKDYQKKLIAIASSFALPTPNSINFYDKNLISNTHQDHDEIDQSYINLYKKMIEKQI